MGQKDGFLVYSRQLPKRRPVRERIHDHNELYCSLDEKVLKEQAARCMDCGVPFCHTGCPIGNLIPDWNDAVYHNDWEKAAFLLQKTNPLPEITGRICPALCEAACVNGINVEPVTICNIEKMIAERGFHNGYIKSSLPKHRTGKHVAVIGSGPAGLAAAHRLNQYGHWVIVFEKNHCIGGLLALGIPDFKLSKHVISRRVKLLKEEGIVFKCNVHIGKDRSVKDLLQEYQAVVLAIGSETPRDLQLPGRDLNGIHFALDYLQQQNILNSGGNVRDYIDAKNKNVVIIGGGDTGADCVGTAVRQGAKKVYQFEILPKPPAERTPAEPWPSYPRNLLRISSSHEEGGERRWAVTTKRFEGTQGKVTKIHAAQVEWKKHEGSFVMHEIAGSEFSLDVDLIILAMGFIHPVHEGLVKEAGLQLDTRGNINTTPDTYATSIDGVFAAGDARRGASLVVWAIAEGLHAADSVDNYLMK